MSSIKVVVEQQSVDVSVTDDNVSVVQYTGSPVYPPITTESPLTYDSGSYTVGLDQTSIYIGAGQVSGLGSASLKDVPVTGDAASDEVVLGNDSRLVSSSAHMPFGIVTDVPGHYLVSMGSGVVNQILPEYRPLFVPMFMSDSAHVDRIAVEVATAASGSGVVRLGIYESNERGLPGNLIVDAGTVGASTVGVKQAVVDETLTGLVWICVLAQNSTVSLKCFTNVIQSYPSFTTGSVSAGKLTLSYNTYYFGTLPAIVGDSPEGMTYYPPLVNLRLA